MKKILAAAAAVLLLLTPALAAEAPEISAQGAILVEGTTGMVLYEKEADSILFPASTTKIMTGILALENCDPDSIVTVSATAVKGLRERGSDVYLEAGEEIPFLTMVRYLLIVSGNDGANALAEHTAGSLKGFVDMMNAKAQELGMTNTRYANAHGLHSDGHQTTARDLAILAQYAMANEVFAQIVSEVQVFMPQTPQHPDGQLMDTFNYMLVGNQVTTTYQYPGTIGVKTGYTGAAGLCFVGAVAHEDMVFYSVALNCQWPGSYMGSFGDTITMIDWAKNNFIKQKIIDKDDFTLKVPVLSGNRFSAQLQPTGDVYAMVPADGQVSDLAWECTPGYLTAPFAQGQEVAQMTVSLLGQSLAPVALAATAEVSSSPLIWISLAVLIAAVAAAVVLTKKRLKK